MRRKPFRKKLRNKITWKTRTKTILQIKVRPFRKAHFPHTYTSNPLVSSPNILLGFWGRSHFSQPSLRIMRKHWEILTHGYKLHLHRPKPEQLFFQKSTLDFQTPCIFFRKAIKNFRDIYMRGEKTEKMKKQNWNKIQFKTRFHTEFGTSDIKKLVYQNEFESTFFLSQIYFP